MKITKVYTRTGDKGQTSIIGGFRMSKASERLEAYGTVDELSSHLGLLAALLPEGDERNMIIRIHHKTKTLQYPSDSVRKVLPYSMKSENEISNIDLTLT